jgi:SAM-dependent methyltransferase
VKSDGVFSGTVDYYVRYRPDFPQAFYDSVVESFGLDGSGTLVDLGTGSGHIALGLAGRFASVVGVDMNEAMLAAARREAAAREFAHIEFRLGTAEEAELDAGSVRLVTIGNALHWMDRDAVLARCREWLAPGGGIAVVDMPGMWSPDMTLGAEPWLEALRGVVERYLGSRRRAGAGYYAPQHEAAASAFGRVGFEGIETGSASVDLRWSADEVVGYLYSTSFANREQLGARVEAFEEELRSALGEAEPSDVFGRRLEARWALGRRGST